MATFRSPVEIRRADGTLVADATSRLFHGYGGDYTEAERYRRFPSLEPKVSRWQEWAEFLSVVLFVWFVAALVCLLSWAAVSAVRWIVGI